MSWKEGGVRKVAVGRVQCVGCDDPRRLEKKKMVG